MPESSINEIQKEIVDLKIRVNNLEKKLTRLQADIKPKSRKSDFHKFI